MYFKDVLGSTLIDTPRQSIFERMLSTLVEPIYHRANLTIPHMDFNDKDEEEDVDTL
jgi:hypothetical protein